jgi:3-phosphoshikimate 1-carboxyvinyltransferase
MIHGVAGLHGLSPGGAVSGRIEVPSSKSIAQRALVAAALCGGATRLTRLSGAADVRDALALVRAAGAQVDRLAPAAVALVGQPPGPLRGLRAASPLDAGESATLARFATAALALAGEAGRTASIGARGTLRARASPALFAALRAAGVGTRPFDARGWPVEVKSVAPPSALALDRPGSSQEVSALLLALAAWPGEHELSVAGPIPSAPYVALTLDVLQRFGVGVRAERGAQGTHFALPGPLTAPAEPLAIEPDASAAAVALAAGCISGGEVLVPGLDARSAQGDVRIVEHLLAFGCAARATPDGLWASGFPTRGAELDLSGEPDLAPVLAAVAAGAADGARATSRLSGLAALAGKESARLAVLAEGLVLAGVQARAEDDTLEIAPGRGPRGDVVLDPHADHRMAFAFALLGLCFQGVFVREPGCVAKSWPDFWTQLERAGALVERRERRA